MPTRAQEVGVDGVQLPGVVHGAHGGHHALGRHHAAEEPAAAGPGVAQEEVVVEGLEVETLEQDVEGGEVRRLLGHGGGP